MNILEAIGAFSIAFCTTFALAKCVGYCSRPQAIPTQQPARKPSGDIAWLEQHVAQPTVIKWQAPPSLSTGEGWGNDVYLDVEKLRIGQ